MLGFFKNLKPDPDGPEGDDQYYSGEAFYSSQDQNYYAPNQVGYNPYTQGQVVNQPQQQYSDQYHQPAGYGSQPQQPVQPGYYGYNPYPGQYYQFAQEPAMQQQQPGAGYYQDPQPTQIQQVQQPGLPAPQSVSQPAQSPQPVVNNVVDPKLLQKEEVSDLPQDELNSLDQDQKQPAVAKEDTKAVPEAVTTEAAAQTTAGVNTGLTETNTVPEDLAKPTTDEDLPRASEQKVDIAALKALNGAVNSQPSDTAAAKENSNIKPPAEDPLEKLMKLVKDKEGKIDESKLKELFVVQKYKISNKVLRSLAENVMKEGMSEYNTLQLILNFDGLAESGKIQNDFFYNLDTFRDKLIDK